jgi:hypothetical protein
VQWWPTAAAIGFAAFVVYGMADGSELAPIVAASGLVYLGAAALQRPWSAWPMFLVTVLVITADSVGLIEIDATWILLGLAGLLAGYGLMIGATRPASGLPLQAIAMVGFGAVAAVALIADGLFGAYLVAAGLLAHAGWDLYHHWLNRVVTRSLAEFCFVLDIGLAAAIVIVTLQG